MKRAKNGSWLRGLGDKVATLAIAVGGDLAPTAFKLFDAGLNKTENGDYLFDAQAAADVMAAYKKHGIDRPIDLEHLSLQNPETSANYDPDARGWAQLELRPDGSLWAVNVKWTPDGAERLTQKRQRYTSPAFGFDPKTRRITQVLNIAITALPATHGIEALVAANMAGADVMPDQLGPVAEALGLGPDASIEDVVAKIKALMAAAPAAPPAALNIQKLGAVPMMDPKLVSAALDALVAGDDAKAAEILKGLIASAAGGDAEPDPGDPNEPAEQAAGEPVETAAAEVPPPGKDKKAAPGEQMAAASMLLSITGKSTHAEALNEVARLRAIAVDVETREAKLAAEKIKLEAGERDSLVVALTAAGERPATAWADPLIATDRAKRKPAEPWASMPIEALRARVAAVSGEKRPAALRPPPSGSADDHGLTADEIAKCSAKKVDPAAYAKTKAAIAARNARPSAQEI